MKSPKTQLRYTALLSLTLCLLASAYAQSNTATGTGALQSNTSGYDNTADGVNALFLNSTGYYNTAAGVDALYTNSTGAYNTAVGVNALYFNTGNDNTAVGVNALDSNDSGYDNTAMGVDALDLNTSGYNNTAVGTLALYSNTTSYANTATGAYALYSSSDLNAWGNTADGVQTLYSNTTGQQNTASGINALFTNTTGIGNTAIGSSALLHNTTGSWNTGLGASAGWAVTNISYATAVGAGAVVSQSHALVLGGPLGSYAQVNVGIGTPTPSNILTIARGGGVAVADGWNTYSSRRFKSNIQTLHGALDKVERLRGVSYDLKANGKHEVGVIAEEVGAVVPEVVTYEKDGKNAQSVDYSRLTALLIEATKEQQALIHQQQAQIARLTRQVKTIQATLKTDGRGGSVVRRAKAEGPTVRQ